MKRSSWLTFVLSLLVSAVGIQAQEFRATVTGTVTDAQGAAIPAAVVEVTNLATNVSQKVTTNTSGAYTIPFLTVGHYRATATAAGFKKQIRNDVELRVEDRVQLDFQMQLGGITEEITISSDPELLETSTATHGQVIDTRSIQDLPLLGRNPFMLTLLSTGVTWANPQPSASERPWDNNGMDNFNINGSQGLTNAFLLDGVPNVSVENTGPANITVAPPPDSTAEFKVQTNSYDSEYGRTSGGTVNVSLKSGTNQLHGALYDFERNTVFNANLFQSNAAGIPRAAFRWTEPGVELDGPIYIPKLYDGRNRSFFMANWEGVSLIQPATNIDTVPTLAERAGNFSGLVQSNGSPIAVYDPTTTALTNGQYLRQAFPGNIIPANRLNPTALAILNFIPLPNASGTSTGLNNLIVPSYSKVGYTVAVGRIDHVVSEKEKLSARAERNGDNAPGGPTGFLGVLATGSGYARKNRGGGLDLTSVLSPTLVLVSRVGYETHMWEYNQPGLPFPLSTLGISQSLVSQLPVQSFPSVSMTGFTGFGPGRNIGNEHNTSGTWSWSEVLSKTVRSHSLKLGGEFWVMLNNQTEPSSSFGTLSFTNAWTQQNAQTASASSGNAFASFVLGYPQSGSILNNQALAYSSHYYAGFFQDDWRINKRLTVNMGVRWDYESPITERYNRLEAGFDPTTASPFQVPGLALKGGLLFAGSSNRLPFHRDLNNWQPRLGFAFQVMRKTVVRGGYAIQYAPTFDLAGSLGFNSPTTLISSNDGGLTPAVNLTNPYPGGVIQPAGRSAGLATLLGQNISFADPDRAIPYVHQFSIGFQQQLPLKAVADVSYVGSRTRDMQVSRNINAISLQQLQLGNTLVTQVPNPFQGKLPQITSFNGATITQQQLLMPYPQFGSITENDIPIGYASFDSLQAKVEKRLSYGFHTILSYTWSKALQATGYLNAQDPINGLARTLSSFDEPFKVVLSGGYDLPAWKSRNWFLRNAVGGWQANLIGTWQAGRPVAEPDAYPTGINPALTGSGQSLNEFFNTCTLSTTNVRENCTSTTQPVAWIVRPAYTLRVTSTYFPNIRYPRPFLMDASLFKEFRFRERYRLQIRLEAFNLTNTVWFGSPGTGVATSSFGVVTPSQANDPRNGQIGAKLLF